MMDTMTDPFAETRARMAALRAELARRKLDGFVVPHTDEYLGEYIPDHSQRLAWLTGFTGSAGLAVVLPEQATLLVDGRYVLQVREQAPGDLFTFRHVADEPVNDWIAENLGAGAKLGYDPWHIAQGRVKALAGACARAGAELATVETNPIDAVWADQPPPPAAPAVVHELAFAGESHDDKRARVATKLTKDAIDAAVLTGPDSIAWLLNIRGGDVPNTPLVLAFALLYADGRVDLCVDDAKLDDAVRTHLGGEVRVRAPSAFGAALDDLAGKRVLADAGYSAAWVFARLREAGAEIVRGKDPCQLPKACKNEVELAGTRAAHVRDGAALTSFLAWLEGAAAAGGVDEMAAEQRLAEFRSQGEHLRGPSFDTISGAGPNSAVVHYHSTPETNRALAPGELYLVDSGAQYLDGTTDVTRTVAIGTPLGEMRTRFTQVLKGHIAIATAIVPTGTTGAQLDSLARAHLWRAGVDFDHGTGHGVGSYLGVHEGPQGISKRAPAELKPGMIVSNEPGYYKAGEFGIRIENLVVVCEVPTPEGGEKDMLGFETITLAPIDRALVDVSLLTAHELAWLDRYHARVAETLTPLVDPSTAAWLAEATAPI